MNTEIMTLAARDVDADIASGVLDASKRGERIARRAAKYSINVIVYSANGVIGYSGAITRDPVTWLFVGLNYGASTNSVMEDHRMVREINGSISQGDAAWAEDAVAIMQERYGPLPVRVNGPAGAVAHLASNGA